MVLLLQAFIENYPEFKKLAGAVSKHVAVVGELSRIVAEHNLMAVSECEQDIVTTSDRNVFQVSPFFPSHLSQTLCLSLSGTGGADGRAEGETGGQSATGSAVLSEV